MARFNGKKVLITGGSSGMGLAGALRIVKEGGSVAVTGLDETRLNQAKAALPAGSLVLRNDAAQESAEELGKAIELWGQLDGLWLNAGYAEVGAPAV